MKFKNRSLKMLAIALFASLAVFVKAENKVENETRQLTGATKISVTDGLNLNLTQGTDEKVQILAPEGKSNLVSTEVRHGVLRITYEGTPTEAKDVFVYVTIKNIDFIQVDGGAKAKAYEPLKVENMQFVCKGNSQLELAVGTEQIKGLAQEKSNVKLLGNSNLLDLNATGSSTIEATIEVTNLKTNAKENSVITLAGKTHRLEIKAEEASTIHASNMNSKECHVDASNDSNVLVCSKKKANLVANGSSKITIDGSPQDRQVVSSEDSNVIFN